MCWILNERNTMQFHCLPFCSIATPCRARAILECILKGIAFFQQYIPVITICLKPSKKQIQILTADPMTRHNITAAESRVK